MLFVLLVSIGMSWLAVRMEKARRQKEAVEAIEGAGGLVFYDYQSEDPSAEPPVPQRARALFGDDFFFDVDYVAAGRDFGDDEATYLKRLTNLTALSLTLTGITDAGLEHLEGLTTLTFLCLSGTQVTDAGLEHLEGLTRLTCLDLNDTPVTDAGLRHLEALTNLRWLSLADTQVTDAGLEHLNGLTHLYWLDLSGTQVTPEGVNRLQEALPECRVSCSGD